MEVTKVIHYFSKGFNQMTQEHTLMWSHLRYPESHHYTRIHQIQILAMKPFLYK
jgi:hypothetical protein